ncbi:MAG: hypothetical protein M5U34_28195 [Chloroflexi bacterium]|nr:hypothetical protein [Chloroflexota bacterium]
MDHSPFLDFGGRNISPRQFFNDTISDVKRTLNLLHGKDVVIELHNEPNLRSEGLYTSWADGAAFARWWLELLQLYKQALPGQKFIYPGLSPGGAVANLKQDRHSIYRSQPGGLWKPPTAWASIFTGQTSTPCSGGLDVLDDYISRFRYKPIYVTEASNNKGGVPSYMKGRQYIEFWQALQKRPTVKGSHLLRGLCQQSGVQGRSLGGERHWENTRTAVME